MLPSSIRQLTLSELDDTTLRQLKDHGEDLLVERKQQLPEPPGFGAAAGSFANTLGGWILLGVSDDGELVGWAPPGSADAQSHLAAVLAAEVEPLPPFVAGLHELDGTTIGVVRVFESEDRPHMTKPTGAVYLRTSKGKEPVTDQRALIDFAREGRVAETHARERLRDLPLIREIVRAPDSATGVPADSLVVIVRLAPVARVPHFTEWPITQAGEDACYQAAGNMDPSSGPPAPAKHESEVHGRGVSARLLRREPTRFLAQVVADSGGVVAGRVEFHGRRDSTVLLDTVRDEMIRPLLKQLVGLLERAEVIGHCVADCWTLLPLNATVRHATRSPHHEMHCAGALTMPAPEEDIDLLAGAWFRELARHSGIRELEG